MIMSVVSAYDFLQFIPSASYDALKAVLCSWNQQTLCSVFYQLYLVFSGFPVKALPCSGSCVLKRWLDTKCMVFIVHVINSLLTR